MTAAPSNATLHACPHTSWQLQVPADSHRGWQLPGQLHGELQPPCLRVEPVSEREAEAIGVCGGPAPGVNDQLLQDILVGEGGAPGQRLALLRRLCRALPSAQLACQTTQGSAQPAGDRACLHLAPCLPWALQGQAPASRESPGKHLHHLCCSPAKSRDSLPRTGLSSSIVLVQIVLLPTCQAPSRSRGSYRHTDRLPVPQSQPVRTYHAQGFG